MQIAAQRGRNGREVVEVAEALAPRGSTGRVACLRSSPTQGQGQSQEHGGDEEHVVDHVGDRAGADPDDHQHQAGGTMLRDLIGRGVRFFV